MVLARLVMVLASPLFFMQEEPHTLSGKSLDEKVILFCMEEYPFQTFDQDDFRKIIDLKINIHGF